MDRKQNVWKEKKALESTTLIGNKKIKGIIHYETPYKKFNVIIRNIYWD